MNISKSTPLRQVGFPYLHCLQYRSLLCVISNRRHLKSPPRATAVAMTNSKCYLCKFDGSLHFKSPGRDGLCDKRKMKGPFREICRKKHRNTSIPVLSNMILASAPIIMMNAMIDKSMNQTSLQALPDTRGSNSYISNFATQRSG